ncbi:alpha/beta hydrolase [Paeniglutamicibacter sp. Y32M11]|uniref:alpha/beta hydrolase n=1 Tax=Paeniglutamicibacter sp. Y32M11 TaxID=2853258 RepID=UPI001C534017|nr:alpha/beta hydrolase [Paeniglutamicibacter sp. Y32M11]QXQ11721.1 alpha/beta hydrolase [Paeniglutamicibacter sp. Y32M11]
MRLSHEEIRLDGDHAKVAYAASIPPKRLIVFIHGFLGRDKSSWGNMVDFPEGEQFWLESDLLFVGYKTIQSNQSIQGLSGNIHEELKCYYPAQNSSMYMSGDYKLREYNNEEYEELYLVGHSMGGVIVKQIVSNDAANVINNLQEEVIYSNSNVRLFSPAHGGFRPMGTLWLLCMGEILSPFISYLADLKVNSPYLTDLKGRCDILASRFSVTPLGLTNLILWARPEHVVAVTSTSVDVVIGEVRGKTHTTICKPSSSYVTPWTFIQSDGVKK